MKEFFRGKEEQAKETLKSWSGTPFGEKGCTKGLEADCTGFIKGFILDMGYPKDILPEFPSYNLDHGLYSKDSQLVKWLMSACKTKYLRQLDREEPVLIGDVRPVSQHMSAHHLVIMETADIFWHVPRGGRVGSLNITKLHRRMISKIEFGAIYRIML